MVMQTRWTWRTEGMIEARDGHYAQRNNRTIQEETYITAALRLRCQGLRAEIESLGLTIKEASSLIGIPYNTFRHYVDGQRNITLTRYLKLGEFFGWDLRHDVNYMYAYKTYSPKQIKKRLKRLGIPTIRHLESELKSYTLSPLRAAVNYTSTRTLGCYATVMYFISREEQELGYRDAIILEE